MLALIDERPGVSCQGLIEADILEQYKAAHLSNRQDFAEVSQAPSVCPCETLSFGMVWPQRCVESSDICHFPRSTAKTAQVGRSVRRAVCFTVTIEPAQQTI